MNAIVHVPDDVLFQEVNDQAAILHLTTEVYYGLDDVGTRMWRALCSHSRVEGALEELLELYEVPEHVLVADLEKFLDTLVSHGLIRLSDA